MINSFKSCIYGWHILIGITRHDHGFNLGNSNLFLSGSVGNLFLNYFEQKFTSSYQTKTICRAKFEAHPVSGTIASVQESSTTCRLLHRKRGALMISFRRLMRKHIASGSTDRNVLVSKVLKVKPPKSYYTTVTSSQIGLLIICYLLLILFKLFKTKKISYTG